MLGAISGFDSETVSQALGRVDRETEHPEAATRTFDCERCSDRGFAAPSGPGANADTAAFEQVRERGRHAASSSTACVMAAGPGVFCGAPGPPPKLGPEPRKPAPLQAMNPPPS